MHAFIHVHHTSIRPSSHAFIHLLIHSSIYPPLHPSFCSFSHLSICQSVCSSTPSILSFIRSFIYSARSPHHRSQLGATDLILLWQYCTSIGLHVHVLSWAVCCCCFARTEPCERSVTQQAANFGTCKGIALEQFQCSTIIFCLRGPLERLGQELCLCTAKHWERHNKHAAKICLLDSN